MPSMSKAEQHLRETIADRRARAWRRDPACGYCTFPVLSPAEAAVAVDPETKLDIVCHRDPCFVRFLVLKYPEPEKAA